MTIDDLQEFVELLDEIDIDHVRIDKRPEPRTYILYTRGELGDVGLRQLDRYGFDCRAVGVYRAAYDDAPMPLDDALTMIAGGVREPDYAYLVVGRPPRPRPAPGEGKTYTWYLDGRVEVSDSKSPFTMTGGTVVPIPPTPEPPLDGD
jgi:hypothetical protein